MTKTHKVNETLSQDIGNHAMKDFIKSNIKSKYWLRIYHGQGMYHTCTRAREGQKGNGALSPWKEDNMETLKREQTAQGHRWEVPMESWGQEESGDKAHLCLWEPQRKRRYFTKRFTPIVCLGLLLHTQDVCVLQTSTCWAPNTQWGDVWRWVLGEMIKPWGWVLMRGLVLW